MSASQIDIIRTVKVNGAVVFASADEQVNPGGTAVIPITVLPGVANQPAALAIVLAKLQAVVIQATQTVTLGFNAVNAAQTVTVGGGPTAGTFTVSGSFPSAWTTAGIAYNATAAQVAAAVQAAIFALGGTVATGAVVAGSGGPMPGAVLLTFSGTLGGQALATMSASAASLTGGTPTASVASTTTGVAPTQTITVQANAPVEWTAQTAYAACPITGNVTSCNLSNPSGVAATVTFVVGSAL